MSADAASVRRVVGCSSHGPGDIVALACAVAEEARGFGFELETIKASRSRNGSPSKYIHLRDRQGRTWLIRVSDHYRPSASHHVPPHLDLVALDGSSGLAEARGFLARAASGQVEWFDRGGRRGRRQRRKPKRLPYAEGWA